MKAVSEQQAPVDDVSEYLNRLPNGANRDTEGLGAMNNGPFVIGSVDEISGEGGKEVPEFVLTRHELEQLAGYWVEKRIDHDFWWFVHQQTGTTEWRESVFISRRLERLGKILGSEAMKTIWENAIASFRKHHPKITNEDWRVFTEGTREEQEAWRDKVFREDDEQSAS